MNLQETRHRKRSQTPGGLAEKMRQEGWNKQEREEGEEALHKLLVSTYNKSAVKVKAELESEEEMKIKRRKEAAEWMKKNT